MMKKDEEIVKSLNRRRNMAYYSQWIAGVVFIIISSIYEKQYEFSNLETIVILFFLFRIVFFAMIFRVSLVRCPYCKGKIIPLLEIIKFKDPIVCDKCFHYFSQEPKKVYFKLPSFKKLPPYRNFREEIMARKDD